MNILIRMPYNISNFIRNYTPEIWYPLAIVLLNGIVHILNTQYLFALTESPNIHQSVQIAISVLGGFSILAGSFISWLLISVVIFCWCELLYDVQGEFRIFFEIVGICHLLLLVGTLACSFFILFGLPADLKILQSNAADAQETLEKITAALSPLKLVGAVARVCFALVLVGVVRLFFQIRWFKAFLSISIPYTVYWTLIRVLQSAFQFN